MDELKKRKAVAEKTFLRELIKKHDGSTSAIAEELDVHESTAFRKMQKHKLLRAAALARARAAERTLEKGGGK